MFGLLGGLLGGGLRRSMPTRRPLLGLLANRMSRSGSSTQQSSSAPRNQVQQQQEQQQQEKKQEEQQQQEQEQAAQAEQAPQQTAQAPPPLVEKASSDMQKVATQRQESLEQPQKPQEQRPVTAALLDDQPTAATQTPRLGSDAPPQAESLVNQTEAPTPVAMPAEDKFPNAPQLALSGLVDKISEIPDRRSFPMEDPNPSKPADTTSQAAYTQGSPSYHYQTMGSWTALTPSFSYKR